MITFSASAGSTKFFSWAMVVTSQPALVSVLAVTEVSACMVIV